MLATMLDPSTVFAIVATSVAIFLSSAFCGAIYLHTRKGNIQRFRSGIARRRVKRRILQVISTKPPLLTRTKPLTFSGWVMASLAAEKPPTELPMKIAGGKLRAVTMSSRTSAKRVAAGCWFTGRQDSPCQGQPTAMVW
jgi:hypothetical protein